MSSSQRAVKYLLAGVLLSGFLVFASLGAIAGDQSVSVGFDPESTSAQPGETVELSVVVSTDGGHGDEGIESSTLRLEYPGEHLDIVGIEPGPFMQQSSATLEVERRSNDSLGVVEFDQTLVDARNGVSGTEFLAHVTFEVDGNAPPSALEVRPDGSEFDLAVTEFPLPVFEQSGEIVVNGGGEQISPDIPEDVQFDTDATTGANEEEGTDNNADESVTEATDESASDDGDEPIPDEPTHSDSSGPGFGPLVVFIGLCILGPLGVFFRRMQVA